jgi:hypothetical protein
LGTQEAGQRYSQRQTHVPHTARQLVKKKAWCTQAAGGGTCCSVHTGAAASKPLARCVLRSRQAAPSCKRPAVAAMPGPVGCLRAASNVWAGCCNCRQTTGLRAVEAATRQSRTGPPHLLHMDASASAAAGQQAEGGASSQHHMGVPKRYHHSPSRVTSAMPLCSGAIVTAGAPRCCLRGRKHADTTQLRLAGGTAPNADGSHTRCSTVCQSSGCGSGGVVAALWGGHPGSGPSLSCCRGWRVGA